MPQAPVSIRLGKIDDIPELQKLIRESVRGLSTGYYNDQQIDSALSYIFGVDTQLITDETYFVAEVEGEIVASGGWSKRATLFGGDQFKKSQPDPLLDPAVDAAHIRAFYVHPRWARKGVGRLILNACEEAALEAGFKRLELMATLPGEPLYSAMGYLRIESAEMKMPDGQSIAGYVMRKSIRS